MALIAQRKSISCTLRLFTKLNYVCLFMWKSNWCVQSRVNVYFENLISNDFKEADSFMLEQSQPILSGFPSPSDSNYMTSTVKVKLFRHWPVMQTEFQVEFKIKHMLSTGIKSDAWASNKQFDGCMSSTCSSFMGPLV